MKNGVGSIIIGAGRFVKSVGFDFSFGWIGMSGVSELLRQLPKMDSLLASASALVERWTHRRVHKTLSALLDDLRRRILDGEEPVFSKESIIIEAEKRLQEFSEPSVVPAINATGIVLHTGLGRCVLPKDVVNELPELLSGYSVLEVDRETGKRCNRIGHLCDMLREFFGVEAACVVNNDAAAVMLTLSTHAKGGEVVVSRGELVEIGGSFRLPEIIAASGVRLVEVGTTNRTRISDYKRAVTDSTKVFLKVHPSNYRIVGYTETVSVSELADLAHRLGIVAFYDLGSGAVVDVGEPTVQHAIDSGVDIVTFSGDKLFGACQAGIILGREDSVRPLKSNPLYRALRLDKIKIGILERVISLYLSNRTDSFTSIGLIREAPTAVKRRANRLLRLLPPALPAEFRVEPTEAEVGGGSIPTLKLPSFALSVRPKKMSEEEVARRLRTSSPPIFARVLDGRLLLDMKCVSRKSINVVAEALTTILESG